LSLAGWGHKQSCVTCETISLSSQLHIAKERLFGVAMIVAFDLSSYFCQNGHKWVADPNGALKPQPE
jgi:hypothetical protein